MAPLEHPLMIDDQIVRALNNSNISKFVVIWVVLEFLILVTFVFWRIGLLSCCRSHIKNLDVELTKKTKKHMGPPKKFRRTSEMDRLINPMPSHTSLDRFGAP
ncbi:hypothetical protein [Schistocephalus solidus rhabdovirus]|uniref:Uncharacterized protein n=1 Tax=Schistocephalus solidus rhabdovirus TaxID=2729339 RepID=A0A6M3S362_9RHAB|nr:hypothetical protein [Schistocephalus solidus rhabdovirus]